MAKSNEPSSTLRRTFEVYILNIFHVHEITGTDIFIAAFAKATTNKPGNEP